MQIWLIEEGTVITDEDLVFDDEGMWVLDVEKHLIGDLLKDDPRAIDRTYKNSHLCLTI